MKICKKCGYTRKATDFGRDDECPKCGIIYYKFEQKLEKTNKDDNVIGDGGKDNNVVGGGGTRKGIKVQTFVLLLSAALLLLMIAFPPFYITYNNLTYNLGYKFLLTNMQGNLSVNTGMLLTQIFALFFLTLIAIFLLKDSKKILWYSTNKTHTLASHADHVFQKKPEKTSVEKVALWNPNVAAFLSLFFTPLFGAYLHTVNWRNLEEKEKASSSNKCFWVIVFVLLLAPFLDYISLLVMEDSIAVAILVILLIAWHFGIGRSQATYLKGKNVIYKKKSWIVPVLLAIIFSPIFLLYYLFVLSWLLDKYLI